MPSTLLHFKGLRAGFSHVPIYFDIKITVNQTITRSVYKILIKFNLNVILHISIKSQYGQDILLKKIINKCIISLYEIYIYKKFYKSGMFLNQMGLKGVACKRLLLS